MNIEPLGLEAGEAADNSLELVPDLIEMLQALFETEVVELLEQSSLRRYVENFSYCRRTALRKYTRNT